LNRSSDTQFPQICCQQVPESLHEGTQARLPCCKQGTGGSGAGQSGVELGRTTDLHHQHGGGISSPDSLGDKNKRVFTNDTAFEKLVYLAHLNIRKKWTMPLKNRGQTAQQLAIPFS